MTSERKWTFYKQPRCFPALPPIHTPTTHQGLIVLSLQAGGEMTTRTVSLTLYGKQTKNHLEVNATFSLQPEEANDHLMNSREENITVILFAAG